ncbi:TPA: CRISPR system precrRNA processing endoribonuclease RAMP protein Cas6, partial [Candidatus Bathyarchaeota archaeon]|nr:CRISPR system precrRNA processing endoribonuclease RAMP protein Cas6 [Candidatus Bathyarchaeota archaeon]
LVETNHRIKPVTAVYDGRRRPRGFIGWVIYEHRKLKPKLSRRISQLMEYANYVGVGRSRAIGFGITEVKAIHNHHQPPS